MGGALQATAPGSTHPGMRRCLCAALLLFSLILLVQRCSFSSGQASLRCDSVTSTGRRPPPKSLIVSLLTPPPRPPSTLPPPLPVNVSPASSPRQTGGTDVPSQRQQRSHRETSDVPSPGRPRVSVQSAERRTHADATVGARAGEICVLSDRENGHSRMSVCASSANVTAWRSMRRTNDVCHSEPNNFAVLKRFLGAKICLLFFQINNLLNFSFEHLVIVEPSF